MEQSTERRVGAWDLGLSNLSPSSVKAFLRNCLFASPFSCVTLQKVWLQKSTVVYNLLQPHIVIQMQVSFHGLYEEP